MPKLSAYIKEQSILLTSIKPTTINLYLKTSTARVKLLSWDNSINVYKSGDPDSLISIQLDVPVSGPYSGNNPKNIKIYGNTRIKYFDCSGNEITNLIVTSAPELETLIS